jgi:uridine kinase
LGLGGSRRYFSAIFDYRTDSEVQVTPRIAEASAVLLFDGVFLLRPELQECWEVTLFVDALFEVTLRRAQQRDLTLFGDVGAVTRRYQERYIPGQKLYPEACRPRQRAAVVVENSDPCQPTLCEGEDCVSHVNPEPSTADDQFFGIR